MCECYKVGGAVVKLQGTIKAAGHKIKTQSGLGVVRFRAEGLRVRVQGLALGLIFALLFVYLMNSCKPN